MQTLKCKRRLVQMPPTRAPKSPVDGQLPLVVFLPFRGSLHHCPKRLQLPLNWAKRLARAVRSAPLLLRAVLLARSNNAPSVVFGVIAAPCESVTGAKLIP